MRGTARTTGLKYSQSGLSKRQQTLLDKAVSLALISDYKQFRHGAIIVKNGKIVSVGVNYYINDPRNMADNLLKGVSCHAEVAALNSARKTNLDGATIYVARVLRDGTPAMSKPCNECQKALKARGVKKVFYTIDSSMEL